MEVEECQSNRTQGIIQLQHVSFEQNVVVDAAALSLKSPSCSRLELKDFEFSDNACGGHCGVTLSHQNRLENIRIRQNRLADSADASAAVLYVPDGSETSIERMEAAENDCPILHVEGGSLNLSSASFAKNTVNVSEADTATPCIRLSNASASIWDTRFEENVGMTGSTIGASNSNVTLVNNTFRRNEARQGGALSLRAVTSALIQSCQFVSNSAGSSGGVLTASESHIVVTDTTFRKNIASDAGGCFSLEASSSLEMAHSTLTRNEAIIGGVLSLEDHSAANVTDSLFRNNSAENGGAVSLSATSVGMFVDVNFTENSASTNGGSMYIAESNATITQCILQNGSAERGGCLWIGEDSYVNVGHSLLRNGTARSGGCIDCEGREVFVHHTTLQECLSRRAGGAMRVHAFGAAIIRHTRFASNRAVYGGGLFLRATTIFGDALVMEHNSGLSGGGIRAIFSGMTITNSLFRNNSAMRGGAVANVGGLNNTLVNVTLIDNQARNTGGALHAEYARLNVSRCTFRNGHGEIGGLIHARESRLLIISDSVIVNGTARSGGCIEGENGSLTLQNTVIRNCRASKNGGALDLMDQASVTLRNVSVTDSYAEDEGGGIRLFRSTLRARELLLAGNTAVGNGGGLFCTESIAVNITDARISNNTARFGGAFDLRENSTGNLVNVTFAGNRAAESGGHCHMKASSLNVTSSSFADGTAEEGGSFFLSESLLNVSDVEVTDGKASESGGFVSAEKRSVVFVESTSMLNGSADVDGGAIALSESDIRAKDLTVSHCTADMDGGAIVGRSASRILCIGCTLQDNNATRGGAVFLEYADPRSLALQLEGSTVVNNSAVYGGSLVHAATGEVIDRFVV